MRGDVVPKMALGRHVKHVAAAQLRQDIEPIEIEAQVPLAIVGAAVRTPEAFYVRADRIEPNDELRERCGRMLPREPRVDFALAKNTNPFRHPFHPGEPPAILGRTI